jgi:hypothetical protein
LAERAQAFSQQGLSQSAGQALAVSPPQVPQQVDLQPTPASEKQNSARTGRRNFMVVSEREVWEQFDTMLNGKAEDLFHRIKRLIGFSNISVSKVSALLYSAFLQHLPSVPQHLSPSA